MLKEKVTRAEQVAEAIFVFGLYFGEGSEESPLNLTHLVSLSDPTLDVGYDLIVKADGLRIVH